MDVVAENYKQTHARARARPPARCVFQHIVYSQDLRILKRCALRAINNVIYVLFVISSDTDVTCRGCERSCSAWERP